MKRCQKEAILILYVFGVDSMMEYRHLGNTGVKVSKLCLGTMTFGDGADKEMSARIYTLARDAGINMFDCANTYAKGESEKILGQLIKSDRDQIVLATKGYYPMGTGVNQRGASRLNLTRALDNSLLRLDTDYVDIYYVHHFDPHVALFETLSALNDFVSQGKILYIGLSNFAAWQIMKAIGISQMHSMASIACIQPMYSLLKRQCESELLPLAISESLGVFPYSPLGGGMLTGKYLEKDHPTSGRFDSSQMYQQRYEAGTNDEITKSYIDFCKSRDYHPVSLAIAWAGSHPGVTAPIIGARNTDQLVPALESLQITMTEELRSDISNLSLSPAMATDREEER